MLYWAFVFLVIGLIAAALGFGSAAGVSFAIAKLLAVAFLLIFLILLIMGILAANRVRGRRFSLRSRSLETLAVALILLWTIGTASGQTALRFPNFDGLADVLVVVLIVVLILRLIRR